MTMLEHAKKITDDYDCSILHINLLYHPLGMRESSPGLDANPRDWCLFLLLYRVDSL